MGTHMVASRAGWQSPSMACCGWRGECGESATSRRRGYQWMYTEVGLPDRRDGGAETLSQLALFFLTANSA